MRILVVEDDQINQRAAKQQLRGHKLTIVNDHVEAERLLLGKNAFDVAIIEDLLPASSRNMRHEGHNYAGKEMPLGVRLGLLAALRGVKYIAVFTDRDHHQHPASACIDVLNPDGEGKPVTFQIQGSRMFVSNNRAWVNNFDEKDLTRKINGSARRKMKENGLIRTVSAKNFSDLLQYLTAVEQATVM